MSAIKLPTIMMLAALLLLSGCGLPSALNPDDHAQVRAVVDQYLELRVRSVVEGNTRALWKRFPRLKENRDPYAGVNAEPELAASFSRSIKPYAGEIDPESVEPMQIEFRGPQAFVRIHGTEFYRSKDYYGNDSGSGSELRLTLWLEKERRWTVVRTDEVTVIELHQ